MYLLGLLNSGVTQDFMDLICQGLHYSTGHIPQIPVQFGEKQEVERIVEQNVALVKEDWDAFETSVDFTRHPLV